MKMKMKMKMLLLAVAAVVSSVMSTQATFTVSLELQGGNCSDQLTLICRHSDIQAPPLWIHNGTVESGEALGTAFPGAMYTVQALTEHTTTITGVGTVQALDGYFFQCVYNVLGNVTKSNAIKYSFIPPDFQPKLKRTDVVQSFSEQLCTLTYAREDYAEGIAKYPRCADQFSVNFTVAPNANMSSISTDVVQCNITNLERCKVYNISARFYRGDQVLDTVLDVDSVMTTPGAFNVSNVTVVSPTVVYITIEEVSPDCPSFPTQWYNITIRKGDGACNQTKQVEANNFPPMNDSIVTIIVIFDTLLPQGMFDVEVLKVNAQNWNSSSKASVFNPHQPPLTMAMTTVPPNAADLAMVAGVSAAVLVVCVVVCCVVLCMCMICCRGRKSTQGNYTIDKPGTARLNSYEVVCHVELGRSTEERVVAGEAGTSNIQEVFSSDEPQGQVQEEDGVLSTEFPNQSAEDPLENGLEEETGRSAGALQRDELEQFYETDKACFNGEEVHTLEESAAVYEIDDEQSLNEPLDEEEQGMPDMVMKVVGRIEMVVVSGISPYPTLQEDTLSLSSSTSLQDPREVIAEMSGKSVVISQVHSSDKDKKDELNLQDGDKAA